MKNKFMFMILVLAGFSIHLRAQSNEFVPNAFYSTQFDKCLVEARNYASTRMLQDQEIRSELQGFQLLSLMPNNGGSFVKRGQFGFPGTIYSFVYVNRESGVVKNLQVQVRNFDCANYGAFVESKK